MVISEDTEDPFNESKRNFALQVKKYYTIIIQNPDIKNPLS